MRPARAWATGRKRSIDKLTDYANGTRPSGAAQKTTRHTTEFTYGDIAGLPPINAATAAELFH